MIEPNIDRKWNEAAAYSWCRDEEGRILAITSHDHTEAIARANRNESDRALYRRRCQWRGHSFAALYLLVGFTLGCVLMIVLAHAGRPT
jgi:hypothetical protein